MATRFAPLLIAFALPATLLLACLNAPAAAASEAAPDAQPLVAVDVSLELAAIERSLAEMSTAVGEMADAMEQIAATGELTDREREHLDNIMANLDHVTEMSRRSVDALPTVVERSRAAARQSAEALVADLKFWFFVVVGVLAVLLAAALAAFYWWTLRPLQHMVLQALRQISDMAQGMANTAKILESVNETQRVMMELSRRPPGTPDRS